MLRTFGVRFYWDADPATRMRFLRSASYGVLLFMYGLGVQRSNGGRVGNEKVMEIGFFLPARMRRWGRATVGRLTFRRECAREQWPRVRARQKSVFTRKVRRARVFTTSIHLNFYRVTSLRVYIFHFTAPPPPRTPPPPLRSWRRPAGRLNGHYVCARPAVHAQGVPREGLFQFFRRCITVIPIPRCRRRGRGTWSDDDNDNSDTLRQTLVVVTKYAIGEVRKLMTFKINIKRLL